jgi:LmbE family N-acetylglucosaminyl deacetylase
MDKTNPSRRNFITVSTMGLSAFMLKPTDSGNETNPKKNSEPDKKLAILCIGAHPGDPEFGCGGTLLKYSEAGHQVTVLYLTRGEASDPSISFAEMARFRTKEAETSCRILKATPTFAGQIDGNTEYNNKTAEEMKRLILASKPDVVFTHWPMDSHKDHQIAGLLTLSAWTQSGQQFQLYFYEVNTGAESMAFNPTDYEDISAYRVQKKSALMAHKTQNPEEVYDQFFRGMEDFRGLEAGVTAAEGFIHFKPKGARAKTL